MTNCKCMKWFLFSWLHVTLSCVHWFSINSYIAEFGVVIINKVSYMYTYKSDTWILWDEIRTVSLLHKSSLCDIKSLMGIVLFVTAITWFFLLFFFSKITCVLQWLSINGNAGISWQLPYFPPRVLKDNFDSCFACVDFIIQSQPYKLAFWSFQSLVQWRSYRFTTLDYNKVHAFENFLEVYVSIAWSVPLVGMTNHHS